MRQRAQVMRRQDNTYWIKVDNPAKACGSCKGCMRITGESRPEDHVLTLNSAKDFQEGDWVIVETEAKDLAKAVAVLYGLPLGGLLLGYGLAYLVLQSDPLAGVGALGGLLVGVTLARPIARKVANRVKDPQIVTKACS